MSVTPPRGGGLRTTAYYCVLLRRYLPSDKDLVLAPSDARERSYIVQLSTSPFSLPRDFPSLPVTRPLASYPNSPSFSQTKAHLRLYPIRWSFSFAICPSRPPRRMSNASLRAYSTALAISPHRYNHGISMCTFSHQRGIDQDNPTEVAGL